MSKKLKVSFNSPVVLWFSIICLGALIAGIITQGATTTKFFSVYRSSLTSPLTWFRITLLLVVGPMLEEKYGSSNVLFVILTTAIVTGVVNYIFFPRVQLLGASGVVFAFILLSSFTSIREGTIPVTFILVAIIYIGGQIYDGIFVRDNVSNLTHIIGGAVGSGLGYVLTKNKMGRY